MENRTCPLQVALGFLKRLSGFDHSYADQLCTLPPVATILRDVHIPVCYVIECELLSRNLVLTRSTGFRLSPYGEVCTSTCLSNSLLFATNGLLSVLNSAPLTIDSTLKVADMWGIGCNKRVRYTCGNSPRGGPTKSFGGTVKNVLD